MILIHLLNALLMVVIPVSLAFIAILKMKLGWRFWLIGGLVFLLSQIGHIPFNYFVGKILNKTELIYLPWTGQILFNACFLGLSAGLWEESFRYLMYRWWIKDARSWQKGILAGLGHGGFESIILGFLAVYTLLQMLALKNADIRTIVQPERLSATLKAVAIYWSMPWYDTLLGSIERTLTLPIQVAFSVLILQVFIKGKMIWFYCAILFHFMVDGIALILISFSTIYVTEMVLLFFSVISIWIIISLRSTISIDREVMRITTVESKVNIINALDETNENLDNTIYQ